MLRKFTKINLEGSKTYLPKRAKLPRVASLANFQFTPEPGFLYVATRAISSRVNANYDGWPPEELEKAYRTFIGRGVYVDHHNWNKDHSRGVILDAKLHRDVLASGDPDYWVELLIEVDASAYPRLAQAIVKGDIDAVSMGADVEYTICSVCSNKAHDVREYCKHIPYMKGKQVPVKVGGVTKQALVWEDCYGVNFFEISFVFDPADESALIQDVLMSEGAYASRRVARVVRQREESLEDYMGRVRLPHVAMRRRADSPQIAVPEPVDTLRQEIPCPQCGNEFDGISCENCGYEAPPEGLDDPSVDQQGYQVPVKDFQQPDSQGITPNVMGRRQVMAGRYSELLARRNKRADLSVDYDQDTTMNTNGEYDNPGSNGSEDVPSPTSDLPGTDPTKNDPGSADPTELDTNDVTGELGQSEVNVQGDEVSHDFEGQTTQSRRNWNRLTPAQKRTLRRRARLAGDIRKELQMELDQGLPQQQGDSPDSWMDSWEESTGQKVPEDIRGEFRNKFKGQRARVADAGDTAPCPNCGKENFAIYGPPGVTCNNCGHTYTLPRKSNTRRRADNVQTTDVTDLSSHPFTDEQFKNDPDTTDVTAPQDQGNQLDRADRPNDVNDGPDTTPDETQVFDDGTYNPPNQSSKNAKLLRIFAFQEEREMLGLSSREARMREIARFESMSPERLRGYVEATQEFKSAQLRTARRRPVSAERAPQGQQLPGRVPNLGRLSAVRQSRRSPEELAAEDALALL